MVDLGKIYPNIIARSVLSILSLFLSVVLAAIFGEHCLNILTRNGE